MEACVQLAEEANLKRGVLPESAKVKQDRIRGSSLIINRGAVRAPHIVPGIGSP